MWERILSEEKYPRPAQRRRYRKFSSEYLSLSLHRSLDEGERAHTHESMHSKAREIKPEFIYGTRSRLLNVNKNL